MDDGKKKSNSSRIKKPTLRKDRFFKLYLDKYQGLAYADVKLKPGYSEIDLRDPNCIDFSSRFSRNITLKKPIVSSPMDTVTERDMAIAMALEGGLGIIHKSLTPQEQLREIRAVKYFLNGLIHKPIVFSENATLKEIEETIEREGYNFRTFPIIDKKKKMVGLITGKKLSFNFDKTLLARDVMIPLSRVIVGKKNLDIDGAFEIMKREEVSVIPLLNRGKIVGMYVSSDVIRIKTGASEKYNTDANNNLRVGVAVGLGDAMDRIDLFMSATKKPDVVVLDTAHGHHRAVGDLIRQIKAKYGDQLDVVAGNVSTGEASRYLVECGADGIRVGQGPGSICTTRIVAGIGNPQVTAIFECSYAIRGSGVPIIADGGIENSGDITVALAAGADCVMLGKALAGTKEAPGDIIEMPDGIWKVYRGMGSVGAMRDNSENAKRYGQGGVPVSKLVPEGIEARVPFIGEVSTVLHLLMGGLRSGMNYTGNPSVLDLQEKAEFILHTSAGAAESHAHGVIQMKQAPNYSRPSM